MTMLAPALYVGAVRHRRFRPLAHSFRRPLVMLFADVEKSAELLRRIGWPARAGLFGWRREDYLRPRERPLKDAAIDAVESLCGRRCAGPVFLLAQPRQFGVGYNPASFYFVCDGGGAPAYLLVEVHNTPWGERFCYAAAYGAGGAALAKKAHVSPFNPPQMTYRWRFTFPGARFAIAMRCAAADGQTDLGAVLAVARRPLSRRNVVRALLWPSAAANLAAIYRQAFALWRKGAPVYPHP